MTEYVITVPGEARGKGRKADNGEIIAAYIRAGSVWKAAAELGMCGQSVHERLVKLGMTKPVNVFSEDERQILREQYESAADAGKLSDLAASMGRTKPFICRQAKALGLTDRKRTKQYLSERSSAAFKAWHAVNQHPRGMLGKKHSDAACEAMSKIRIEIWQSLSEDEQAKRIIKMLKSRAASNGGKLSYDKETREVSWRQGWREIGGQRCYFRSTWEANYARYLQTLLDEGMIRSWEHEPHTFWFEGIRRGSMSYLPDFKVTALDGSITWHEVKGWMDERSKTKIARMAKYFPEAALVVISKAEYEKIRNVYRYVIDGWEVPPRPKGEKT